MSPATIIDINIPWSEIVQREARVKAVYNHRYLDRVPVLPCILPRYWLQHQGLSWQQYIADPRTMLESQLQAHKWLLEEIPGDHSGWGVSPDLFSFYHESYGLGCELGCDELSPWITSHPVGSEADLRRLEDIDAADNRATQAFDGWIKRMTPLLENYRLRYSDGEVHNLPARLTPPGNSIGIFTLATDLRGPDIYLDLYARPDFARELLRIVTDKTIARYRWLQSQGIGVGDGVFLVDDSSGALSPALYREFVLPCVLRVVAAIGRPLTIHIDAPANHLLPIYQELDVHCLSYFGWGTSPQKVRTYLGGRAVVIGNLSPALLLSASPEEVYQAAWQVLEVLAPCGGFILADGANIAPGTPPANIGAMVRAAQDFGLPEQGRL
jgi:uroporphyrinogen-III decarboxylase